MRNLFHPQGRAGDRTRQGLSLGFSLVELLVVIGIIAVLMSILLPVVGRMRDRAKRVQCASNLRQLAVAMRTYANAEGDGGFPRTTYDPRKKLELGNAGYQVVNSFGNSGYVSENNVPASLFLLLKNEKMPPELFVCPSTNGTPGFVNSNPLLSSNWDRIPDNMSYSLAAPFPSAAAVRDGFDWRNTLAAEFAVAGDINPGTRGGKNPPNNSIGPPHDAGAAQMAAANSNNHANKGQNVAYADGHVEFQDTPYCGAFRSAAGFRDNIYTAGPGDGGITDETALPVDRYDSVLLPTDDPGGK